MNMFDTLIFEVDNTLRTLFPPAQRASTRSSPAESLADTELSTEEKRHVAGLMRVNHAGEVCAQALYQGQALTAQLTHIKKQMSDAAAEETDHLAWCEERLAELGSKPSILNPLWYGGSLILGAVAGFAGDKVSLGFVAETERQVAHHLHRHLKKLPAKDKKSHAILIKMKEDEEQHATTALNAGAIELPYIVKQLMHVVSKLMTKSSYYV
ncbi:2-polyprenyl-3-methyl-6-methoxy-1,4-benzoquinone monooxygenase [Legionella anisa]|uniref:3-demethoxyubiquinol 3-hydroxylase n=1 Tax=Legionella anisa TaxID=28082 RepID=A0AAX0WYQ9_9GAMM|nr:2-polyprenyl-3-methyl-6-methoxy-1,4-benzoquinone monooxygenase [Legionella anisa]AWN72840.1 demethoxyubiquinone hydroxylase family protein [Legionella anisa]KTC70715.1 ubiquinone biosynthesis protein [Legionella anisa]MBN5934684.1 2-polyprenyl-3-methyl-6-methoxy-1,4-benzoquinone monooxygenase [Legionella anisa]MCW8423639.1 2-polyprenyl-3-methyl-6-methoxy-1,4-benzoquinone monooxygenase [Legionella anisa]MCW8447159.1 2-polyprenyl-3-methyl-6-methoxy-1,4-benzoquinone monooxygenase [Legionella a